MIIASLVKREPEVSLYEVEETEVQKGRLEFLIKGNDAGPAGIRVRGTASYWEIVIQLPPTRKYRGRSVTLHRKAHLTDAMHAIDNRLGKTEGPESVVKP